MNKRWCGIKHKTRRSAMIHAGKVLAQQPKTYTVNPIPSDSVPAGAEWTCLIEPQRVTTPDLSIVEDES